MRSARPLRACCLPIEEALGSTSSSPSFVTEGNGLSRYNRVIVNEPEAPTAPRQEDEPMLWCPVCSTRLTERKCKLICEKCGYHMSCADYY